MKPVVKKILIVTVIAGLIAAVKLSGYDQYLTFASLKQYKEQLLVFVHENYIPSVMIFIALYVAVVALTIPGAAVLSLAAGFLFGMMGVLFVNVGATTGAALAFLAARYVLGGWVQGKYAQRLQGFNNEIQSNGANYLLTLRLIPAIPFWLINLMAGLTRVSLVTFVWTTALGIIPGSIVFVYAGTQLGSVNSISDLFSFRVLTVFVLFMLLAIMPVVIKKIKGLR